MKRFEYRIIKINPSQHSEYEINDLGIQGWEIAGTFSSGIPFVILKREIIAEPTDIKF